MVFPRLSWSNVEQPDLWKTTSAAQCASSLIDELRWSIFTARVESHRASVHSSKLATTARLSPISFDHPAQPSFNTLHCWWFLFLDPVQLHRCFQIFIFPQDNFWMERRISQPETKAQCRRFSQWVPFSIVFCYDTPAVTGSVPIAGIKPKNRRYDTHRQLLLVLKVRLTCHMRVWAAKLYNGFIIELHTLAIQVEASFLGEHIALRKLSLLLTFNLCNFDCCKL